MLNFLQLFIAVNFNEKLPSFPLEPEDNINLTCPNELIVEFEQAK
jgi:hypothetical protein